jgi:hypothetical protein
MQGFISYAHDDHGMFQDFKTTHLRAVERAFGIEFWSDDRIGIGYRWDPAILSEIDVALVFVLLVSPAFIASDYIWYKELPAITARHSADALVLPVVLHRCQWQMICGPLQATPIERGRLKPVADWRPRRNGFDCAREQMAKTIETYFGITPTKVDW